MTDATQLELERLRVESDIRLRQQELDIRREEMRAQRRLSVSPVTLAIIAGLSGLIGTGIGSCVQGKANLALEQQKLESQLILKACDTNDKDISVTNLQFFLEAGLLKDTKGNLKRLASSPTTVPALQLSGFPEPLRNLPKTERTPLAAIDRRQSTLVFQGAAAVTVRMYLNRGYAAYLQGKLPRDVTSGGVPLSSSSTPRRADPASIDIDMSVSGPLNPNPFKYREVKFETPPGKETAFQLTTVQRDDGVGLGTFFPALLGRSAGDSVEVYLPGIEGLRIVVGWKPRTG